MVSSNYFFLMFWVVVNFRWVYKIIHVKVSETISTLLMQIFCLFSLQADPPNPSSIPAADALGVTVVLITCSFRNQEFVRVGYYVNNEYVDPEMKENPPLQPVWDQVCIKSNKDKTLYTKFKRTLGQ